MTFSYCSTREVCTMRSTNKIQYPMPDSCPSDLDHYYDPPLFFPHHLRPTNNNNYTVHHLCLYFMTMRERSDVHVCLLSLYHAAQLG